MTLWDTAVATYLRNRGWVQVQIDGSGRLYWKKPEHTRVREKERAFYIQMGEDYDPKEPLRETMAKFRV